MHLSEVASNLAQDGGELASMSHHLAYLFLGTDRGEDEFEGFIAVNFLREIRIEVEHWYGVGRWRLEYARVHQPQAIEDGALQHGVEHAPAHRPDDTIDGNRGHNLDAQSSQVG